MRIEHEWARVPLKQGFGHFVVDRVDLQNQALLGFDSLARVYTGFTRAVTEFSRYDLSTREGKEICVRLILNPRRQMVQLIPGKFSVDYKIETELHDMAAADRNGRR